MKKANLFKKLTLNKVTIAGLNASNTAGVLGGRPPHSVEYTCPPCGPQSGVETCGIDPTIGYTCGDKTSCIFPVTSEPTDPTYTC
ncbi:MAG: hypothetical protein GY765_34425 [bacterium]|nr:hypothetical protein [bacterium]